MELINIAENIHKLLNSIAKGRELIKERANEKALAIAEYDREMAIVLIKLKNGYEYELDGEKIQNPPATIMEKIAKGICSDVKFRMEKAEAEYKNAVIGMEALKTEINGYQSLYKHIDEF